VVVPRYRTKYVMYKGGPWLMTLVSSTKINCVSIIGIDMWNVERLVLWLWYYCASKIYVYLMTLWHVSSSFGIQVLLNTCDRWWGGGCSLEVALHQSKSAKLSIRIFLLFWSACRMEKVLSHKSATEEDMRLDQIFPSRLEFPSSTLTELYSHSSRPSL
jgi:hypothetical protein